MQVFVGYLIWQTSFLHIKYEIYVYVIIDIFKIVKYRIINVSLVYFPFSSLHYQSWKKEQHNCLIGFDPTWWKFILFLAKLTKSDTFLQKWKAFMRNTQLKGELSKLEKIVQEYRNMNTMFFFWSIGLIESLNNEHYHIQSHVRERKASIGL